ncbi:hypothetical protein GCM10007874_05950 [Labrys miyagiensis]|uniref:Uncharacterized protein n=2 Tax=Labrys miyagiensis TaxID=346912 RepID=A0ABQ6CCA0_9HYPH|nr:hypothetical protein GCM10007874_05950 [Labrys miyagiensis]
MPVWFITSASRRSGTLIVKDALAASDAVIATARKRRSESAASHSLFRAPEEASSHLTRSRISQIHVTKIEEYQGPD